MSCSRCAMPDLSVPDSCRLYLVPPGGHAAARLRSELPRIAEVVDPGIDGIMAIRFDADQVAGVVSDLADLLSPAELEDSRSLLIEDGAEPSLADLMRTEPLARWIARMRARYVVDLIGGGGLFFHFQPIVYGRAPSSVFAHECLMRGKGKDGEPLSPLNIYNDAREAGLLFQLDKAARMTAIREVVRHRLPGRIFINFNPASIYDPATCLRSTVQAIREAGIAPGRVTFEIVECEKADPMLLTEIVRLYRLGGFRVALDDLGAGYSSLNLLHTLRPEFVKLDRDLTTGVDLDPYRACIAAPLLKMAQDLGIETVAEGVETEGELRWLQARNVDYIQGYLIARPGLPPFDLNHAEPAPAPEAEGPVEAVALGIAE